MDIPRLAKIGSALTFLMYVAYQMSKGTVLIAELITLTYEKDANENQKVILTWLRQNRGMVKIAPGGNSLCALAMDPSGETFLFQATGPNFNKMTPTEIDNYIFEKLEEKREGN